MYMMVPSPVAQLPDLPASQLSWLAASVVPTSACGAPMLVFLPKAETPYFPGVQATPIGLIPFLVQGGVVSPLLPSLSEQFCVPLH